MQEKPFDAYRSVGECLSSGVSLLTDCFLHRVRQLLPWMLLLAMVLTVAAVGLCRPERLAPWCLGLLAVAALGVLAAYQAAMCRLLREARAQERQGKNPKAVRLWGRMLVTDCVLTVAVCACCVLAVKAGGAYGLLVAVAGLLAAVPAMLCVPAVGLGDGGVLRDCWRGYCMGWRKWVKVFSLSLLTGLIMMVLGLLVLSPALVVMLIRFDASQTLLEGDAAVLPMAFRCLAPLLLFVSFFLMTLLLWLGIVPQAYLWAAFRSAGEERDGNVLSSSSF